MTQTTEMTHGEQLVPDIVKELQTVYSEIEFVEMQQKSNEQALYVFEAYTDGEVEVTAEVTIRKGKRYLTAGDRYLDGGDTLIEFQNHVF